MDSPFLGMVQYFAFDFVPKGYAACNGALLSIQSNTALFALLGTYYGGNGSTTFGLPDLQGRAVVGQSSSLTIGEKFGNTSATLLTANMPSHTHTVTATIPANSSNAGNVAAPAGNYPSAGPSGGRGGTTSLYTPPAQQNGQLGNPTFTVAAAGNGIPFNTQNPYLALTACISTVGIFPSRN